MSLSIQLFLSVQCPNEGFSKIDSDSSLFVCERVTQENMLVLHFSKD